MMLSCARCGTAFACGMDDKDQPCWCTELPHIAPSADIEGCLCPPCLALRVSDVQKAQSAPDA